MPNVCMIGRYVIYKYVLFINNMPRQVGTTYMVLVYNIILFYMMYTQ